MSDIPLPPTDTTVPLPVEVHLTSVWPDGTRRPCTYRYATEAARDSHLDAEAAALGLTRRRRT